ncbi:transposase [Piscirickettsia salmonis]|uniref:transposase n=1 Tax=Piscirickettsia salmonis TaxID=1238 RepID=UPI0012BABE37|nr:transposase [Piscirickettsia salmonis]
MDEAGMDDTERYAYGYSAKGKRCYAEKPGSKSIRINFMGGLRGKQFIAPMVVEGYCNNNVCQAYIDQCLIPSLSPGETVIMDNASFHKSKGVKEARKRRYLGRYFAHPMMQNRRAKRDDYKSSAVRVTQRYVP